MREIDVFFFLSFFSPSLSIAFKYHFDFNFDDFFVILKWFLFLLLYDSWFLLNSIQSFSIIRWITQCLPIIIFGFNSILNEKISFERIFSQFCHICEKAMVHSRKRFTVIIVVLISMGVSFENTMLKSIRHRPWNEREWDKFIEIINNYSCQIFEYLQNVGQPVKKNLPKWDLKGGRVRVIFRQPIEMTRNPSSLLLKRLNTRRLSKSFCRCNKKKNTQTHAKV